MLTTALLEGNETAWKVRDVPIVLELARNHMLACLGGQFQFRFDNGICEMYWLNADSAARKQSESWEQYVNRSINEVLTRFESLLGQTDFDVEVRNWKFLNSKRLQNVELTEHLFFVAYFVSEDEDTS